MKKKKEALKLLEESLKELESQKGSILTVIQKISRASLLLDKENIVKWCEIQLGNKVYTAPLEKYINLLEKLFDKKPPNLPLKEKIQKIEAEKKILRDIGLEDIHFDMQEMDIKKDKRAGGYSNIGYIEKVYIDLEKNKEYTNGLFYKSPMLKHISYIRSKAYSITSKLYNEVKFSDTVGNCFDVLKTEVDDRLLDLNPEIAEQMMLAFKAVSSSNKEEWSHALTSCRRLLEGLADVLFPVSDSKVKGRTLGQGQYVNRLWAFMDKSIQSDSNKELAKAHVDLLGSWMEKTNKFTNKGVHSSVTQIEATKTVFHTYLVIADILEYLVKDTTKTEKPDINNASLDELEALLDINRTMAKEIYKMRVTEGYIDIEMLSKINGIGIKTLEKIKSVFVIND